MPVDISRSIVGLYISSNEYRYDVTTTKANDCAIKLLEINNQIEYIELLQLGSAGFGTFVTFIFIVVKFGNTIFKCCKNIRNGIK